MQDASVDQLDILLWIHVHGAEAAPCWCECMCVLGGGGGFQQRLRVAAFSCCPTQVSDADVERGGVESEKMLWAGMLQWKQTAAGQTTQSRK